MIINMNIAVATRLLSEWSQVRVLPGSPIISTAYVLTLLRNVNAKLLEKAERDINTRESV